MRHDAEFFARQLFTEYCRLPFAEHHRQLFAWHEEMGKRIPQRRGRRYVLAAPRGSAKSTVASLILPLHDIVYSRERYIILLSATERQAEQRLRALRGEIERGSIREFFHVQPGHSTARSLDCGRILVEAFGAGTEIRGISHEGYRPTKIILDDAEASRAASSPLARRKLSEWFAEVVEHLGDRYTNLLAVGTVLHPKGLIPELLERPDFTGSLAKSIVRFSSNQERWREWRRLLSDPANPAARMDARRYFETHRKAMERGTHVLWPEKEDYEELMCQLTLQGRRAFYQEKQNTPLGPEDALFDPALASRSQWRGEDLVILAPGGDAVIRTHTRPAVRRFGYLDTAMGKGGRAGSGDFAALAAVILLPGGELSLERLWARRASPTEQVKAIFAQHDTAPFELLGIEGIGFQELLADMIHRENARRRSAGEPPGPAIEIVKPTASKAARIGALEPLLTSGRLSLGADLDEEFWEELANYPRTPHDDTLDAAAGAAALAETRRKAGGTLWESAGGRIIRV